MGYSLQKIIKVMFSAKLNVNYYWRKTINIIKESFTECKIERSQDDNVIIIDIMKNLKSCEIKFENTQCFLNGEKIDASNIIEKINFSMMDKS